MKSARVKACLLWDALPASAKVAIDLNYRRDGLQHRAHSDGKQAWIADVQSVLKEHARDQRQNCSDAIMALDLCGECPEASIYTRDDACVAASTAPAPGENR